MAWRSTATIVGTDADATAEVPEKETNYPESFMFDRMPLPAYGFYIRHADGVVLENVKVEPSAPDERPPVVADDASVNML